MEALSPIPNPIPNDDEDVSWALSTAGALWGRGERSEALKWLRRAAEQASDANDDVRALALFKAAADVSAQVSASTPPPPSSSIAPPSTNVTPPPVASAEPPTTTVTPPPVASVAPSASSSPRASAPPPPPRKGPPSLPPRNSRPPLPPSRSQAAAPASTQAPPPPSTQIAPPQAAQPQAAPPQTAPPQAARPQAASPQAAPPQAASPQAAPPPGASAPRAAVPPRARQAQSTEAPPVTKVSRTPGPSSVQQISPTARSMPVNGLADAAVPVRRPEVAPQRPAVPAAPARTVVSGVTVPTRPVAFAPSPLTTPLPPVATERLPPSRRGRVFEEIAALQQPSGGHGFDDLDENTQVIQAARSAPISRKSTAQEVDESFQGLLADPRTADSDAVDEPTDPGLSTRSLYGSAVDETTGPTSVPERTAVWTPAERAAMMALPDNHGPDITSRRFAPLLAHRVAVVASKTPGELRLVPLDSSGTPPAGAAIALLVPLSAADDDLVARLLGSLE